MILEKIRSKTGYVHRRLEESSILSKLTQQSFSLSEYQHVLQKLYGFLFPLEMKLFSIPNLNIFLPDLNQRKKLPLLQTDLEAIDPFFKPSEIKICNDLPEIKTISHAFGYLYVIEGSTLGGKIISNKIAENLHLDECSGIAYFTNYGSERGTMWKNFIHYLNNYSLNLEEEEIEVTDTAMKTFLKLEQWVNQK